MLPRVGACFPSRPLLLVAANLRQSQHTGSSTPVVESFTCMCRVSRVQSNRRLRVVISCEPADIGVPGPNQAALAPFLEKNVRAGHELSPPPPNPTDAAIQKPEVTPPVFPLLPTPATRRAPPPLPCPTARRRARGFLRRRKPTESPVDKCARIPGLSTVPSHPILTL